VDCGSTVGLLSGSNNNANKIWVLKIDAQLHTVKEAATPAARNKSAYPGAGCREGGEEV
jgi:hypothetical protein